MAQENEKLDKVLNLLRKSSPLLDSSEDIEKEVIKRIKNIDYSGTVLAEAFDFMFGWIYIGWVRRCLVVASVALVLLFAYQQAIILRRIDYLSRQTVVSEKENTNTHADEMAKMLVVLRNAGRRFPSNSITISEKQMKELLESVNELQLKYKDLENLIESDPELKKMIQKKLMENNRTKINL
jgi:hypothetical protein